MPTNASSWTPDGMAGEFATSVTVGAAPITQAQEKAILTSQITAQHGRHRRNSASHIVLRGAPVDHADAHRSLAAPGGPAEERLAGCVDRRDHRIRAFIMIRFRGSRAQGAKADQTLV